MSSYIWKVLNEEVIPSPTPRLHKSWKDAQNAIENPKLSSVADFKRTAHLDCMFPSFGIGKDTKKPKKNQFIKQKEVTCTFGIGLRELIIYPIYSNGDPHGLGQFIVYLTMNVGHHNMP